MALEASFGAGAFTMRIPMEVQAILFFTACTVVGLALVVLALVGAVRDRGLVGLLGAGATILGSIVLRRAVNTRLRARRDQQLNRKHK